MSLKRRGRGGVVLGKADELFAEFSQKAPTRISSTEPIIGDILAPSLPELYEYVKNIRIEFSSSTVLANLERQEASLAIRLFRPEGDNLIAKRLRDIEMACFASNKYLKGKDCRFARSS